MDDLDKSQIDNESRQARIRKIAEDLFEEKLFTSLHLWAIAQGDVDEWYECMRSVFNYENLRGSIREIAEALTSSDIRGVLYYAYMHENKNPNKDELPKFDTAYVLVGDDLRLLDVEIKKLCKLRLH